MTDRSTVGARDWGRGGGVVLSGDRDPAPDDEGILRQMAVAAQECQCD